MTTTSSRPSAKERRANKGRRTGDVLAALPDFRSLTDNDVRGVLVHSNFRPLYANDAFARLFGYNSADAIMAMPIIRPLIPPDLWPSVEERYTVLIHGGKEPAIIRTRGMRRDGREIWLSVAEQAIQWHGRHAVHLSAFDISDWMAVEQAMLANEQRLRSMLDVLPTAIYIARRADGKLLFVNRKTCLLFQQSAGRLLRSHSTEFFVDPKDREHLRVLLDAVPDIREVEVRMCTAQGRGFIAELAAFVLDYAGEPAVLVSINDISQRKKLEAELFQQANTDSLTGISNRRNFIDQAEQELRRARRFGRPLSVLMIDCDHFKPINDRLGHAVGDAVLQGIVKAAAESLRTSDILGRLGGEEFAALLPETGLDAACDVAERLREHIASRPIITAKEAVTCTVSVGVTELRPEDGDFDHLLQRADDAMYKAKNTGRNRIKRAE